MKYLNTFKLFESVSKPNKKFPTDKAIHWNYIEGILKKEDIDIYSDLKGRGTSFYDFCAKYCSIDIVFPNRKDNEGWDDRRYENFIFGESIFLLPEKHDSSGDLEKSEKEKEDFLNTMKEYADMMLETEKEKEEFLNKAMKSVKFDSSSYDHINKPLKIIYDELSEYYKDGKLRVWFPKDRDYRPWEGYDYPHKYNVEAWTSKINCMTGNIEFNSDLKNRFFNYEDLIIDRDVNSCINILKNSGVCLTQDSKKSLLLNKMSELKVY